MAVLPLQDRQRINIYLNRNYGEALARMNLLKNDVQQAINAADQWCDANTASYVAALPEPFKTNSNAAEKGLLMALVVMRRVGISLLRVQEDG